MKCCNVCQVTKPAYEFSKHSGFADGRRSTCKHCYNIWQKSDVPRFIKKMYATQKASSTKRGHAPPSYTREDLYNWVINQANFKQLWDDYQSSGQVKDLAPSADRVDPNKPYSLNNLELVTWSLNNARGAADTKSGKVTTKHKQVQALNIDGTVYKTYVSLHEAARDVGGTPTNIQRVADKTIVVKPDGRTTVLKSSKGFRWKWL